MVGSERAAITADAGRGDSDVLAPEDYKVILPPLPSGEGMKLAVVLHCDISRRPYRIQDFRKPLEDAGVIKDLTGIGAYQMSHVWLLKFRTDAAKLKLLELGRLFVGGSPCLVMEPTRQELRVKLHWVSFDVTNEAIRKTFAAYGDVKEVAYERWKVPGFEGVESTTRIVRIVLREGVAPDRLPHQLRFGNGAALVVVPGRAPICLRCRKTGHIRRDCRAPRCTECREFGHERADCVRSYARAVGKDVTEDQAELVMDEEEAEKAAAPAEPATEGASAEDRAGCVPSEGSTPEPEQRLNAAPAPEVAVGLTTEAAAPVASGPLASTSATAGSEMDVEATSAKRRHDDDVAAIRDQRLNQLERQWKVVTSKKRAVRQPRSSSLERPGELSQ